MRQRKSCSSSSLEGALNEKTWHPAGLTPVMTARIVPSLPAASMAWNTTRREQRSSAYSLRWSLRIVSWISSRSFSAFFDRGACFGGSVGALLTRKSPSKGTRKGLATGSKSGFMVGEA